MLAIDRHKRIMDQLAAHSSVKVSEMSALLQVTEKTIREDLEKLEKRGLLKRIHGGAVPALESGEGIYPPSFPNTRELDEKDAIAALAAEDIQPHDIIALDNGSTTLAIAQRLDNVPLTVVTNDILIIRELALKDRIRLVVPGGYRQDNLLIQPESLDWLRRMNIHKLFLSTTGIHPEYGLTIFTAELLPIKRLLIEASGTVCCVADHSKYGVGALHTFATLQEVDRFITGAQLTDAALAPFLAQGVTIERTK
ncbi:DeoR/GlpR family DNA-binding transcription regulator [Paenibacillus daejeonensis]|uniref:DeoR/GlpR family DNA-binding transcription regulator n=1 Tax=Paenibacillus daejeonensis TaxID=135193 RepID=UPI000378D494|nr:DeoR/GlpR family DNA-binding transcription regulator [Paenibacillus daejeonensis]